MRAFYLTRGGSLSSQSSTPFPNAWRAIRWGMAATRPGSLPLHSSVERIADSNLQLHDFPHSGMGGDQLKRASLNVRTTGGASVLPNKTERRLQMGKVGAVFFDMDDTLVLTHEADRAAHRAVQAAVAGRLPHVDTNVIIEVFVEAFTGQAWDPDHQVDVTEWRARMWGKALAAQGVHDIEFARELQDCFDTERMLAFQWAEGVELIVKALVAQGVKVGIITNGHFKVQRRKLEACKASSLFGTILVGGEEPHQKPHVDIFHKACKLAGCTPGETIMVGDNLEADIGGAINAGFLATVWVNLHNLESIPEGSQEPHYVISSIAELPEALKQLGLDLKPAAEP